jgi:hypothetical protein
METVAVRVISLFNCLGLLKRVGPMPTEISAREMLDGVKKQF